MAPCSLYSAILYGTTHKALVKRSAFYKEYGAIWDVPIHFHWLKKNIYIEILEDVFIGGRGYLH